MRLLEAGVRATDSKEPRLTQDSAHVDQVAYCQFCSQKHGPHTARFEQKKTRHIPGKINPCQGFYLVHFGLGHEASKQATYAFLCMGAPGKSDKKMPRETVVNFSKGAYKSSWRSCLMKVQRPWQSSSSQPACLRGQVE